MDPVYLKRIEFVEITVTSRTTWCMAELIDSDGLIGLVEISRSGSLKRSVHGDLAEAAYQLYDKPIKHESEVPGLLGLKLGHLQTDFVLATVVSAHSTAAVRGAYALEHAVNEADWRSEVLAPPERIEAGRLWFPQNTRLGAILSNEIIKKRGDRRKP